MSKNVLVVTGSPRKGGNTDLLADAFIEGLMEAGHMVNRFDAGRKKIGGCTACQACFRKGVACSFKDDFNEGAPFVEQADVIVFASPLYFYSFTAQIKAFIDKFYSFYVGERPLKIKESMLLACGETTELSDFEGMRQTYKSMIAFLGWQDKGQLIATDINLKGEIVQKGQHYLQKAKELGRSV